MYQYLYLTKLNSWTIIKFTFLEVFSSINEKGRKTRELVAGTVTNNVNYHS